MAKMFAFVALVPIFITVAISQRITPAPPRAVADITPIPMDSLNPRLTGKTTVLKLKNTSIF